MSTLFYRSVALRLLSNAFHNVKHKWTRQMPKSFYSSPCSRDLMEFFDDKKNWGEQEVKTGRSWTKDDLRIKSNTDLHKLWYVLLKERNMLLTMEYDAKKECELFPSPERIDKVEESMENLEEVVRERNRAYYELETGETGERPFEMRQDIIGREYRYDMSEHVIPEALSDTPAEEFYDCDKDVEDFQLRLQEKEHIAKVKESRRRMSIVKRLLKQNPNLDEEALQNEYPEIDIEKVKHSLA